MCEVAEICWKRPKNVGNDLDMYEKASICGKKYKYVNIP